MKCFRTILSLSFDTQSKALLPKFFKFVVKILKKVQQAKEGDRLGESNFNAFLKPID